MRVDYDAEDALFSSRRYSSPLPPPHSALLNIVEWVGVVDGAEGAAICSRCYSSLLPVLLLLLAQEGELEHGVFWHLGQGAKGRTTGSSRL